MRNWIIKNLKKASKEMKWKIWPVSNRKESEIKKKDKDKRDVKED
jgi:hypothetical protein